LAVVVGDVDTPVIAGHGRNVIGCGDVFVCVGAHMLHRGSVWSNPEDFDRRVGSDDVLIHELPCPRIDGRPIVGKVQFDIIPGLDSSYTDEVQAAISSGALESGS